MSTDILQQLPLFSNEPETITIPLTQGQETVISAVDADLAQLKWFAQFIPKYAGGGNYMVRRNITHPDGTRNIISMHRVILQRMLGRELHGWEFVDHIDGNARNNQRSNLRLADRIQNAYNTKKPTTNTSGYKGVSWHKRVGKWAATITNNRKQRHLGYFTSAEEAYACWLEVAKELHGEFFNPG